MRPLSEIWQHWTSIATPGKLRLVECNYCSNRQGRNATKCQWHTLKCKGEVPEEFRIFLRESLQKKRKRSDVGSNLKTTLGLNLVPAVSHHVTDNITSPSFSRPTRANLDSQSTMVQMYDGAQYSNHSNTDNENAYCFEDEIEISSGSACKQHLLQSKPMSLVTLPGGAHGRLVCNPRNSGTTGTGACARTPPNTNMINIISKKKYRRLSNLFGKAMFTSHVPFHFVDNPFLKEFFKELSSGFLLPSRRELSESILSSVHEETQEENLNKIERSKFVTLILTCSQPSVVNVMLCLPEPIFYRSVEIEEAPLTPSGLANVIQDVGLSIGPSKVCAFFLDTAPDLLNTESVVTEKLSHVLGVRSAAHILNSFINNVSRLQTVYQTLDDVKYIFSEFQKSKVKMQLFNKTWNTYIEDAMREGQSVTRATLYINSETKWPAALEMLEKLRDSKAILQILTRSSYSALSAKTKALILNEKGLWHRVTEVYALLKSIIEGIVRVESDSSAISDATEVFKGILSEFSPHRKESSSSKLTLDSVAFLTVSEAKMIKFFVQEMIQHKPLSDAHIAAYMLDPRFKNELLTAEEVSSGLHFMWNYAKSLGCATDEEKEELSDSWQEFDTRTGIFDCEILFGSKKINPGKWWQSSVLVKSHGILATIASRLLSIPASSTVAEKNFPLKCRSGSKRIKGLSEVQMQKLISIETSFNLTCRETDNGMHVGKEAVNVDDIITLDDPFPINSSGDVQLQEVRVYYLTEVETDYHEHDYSVQ